MILALSKIRIDGGTQSRASVDPDTVTEYADAIHGGAEFPPMVVFYDGADHWLADGFHRNYAYRKLARKDVECKVVQGTRRDAILYSVGANATHGKRRTNADKRIAVEALLGDEEWKKNTDTWIAKQCAVTQQYVSKVRSESESTTVVDGARQPRAKQGGGTYTPPVRQTSLAAREPEPEPAEEDEPESERRPAPVVHRDPEPDTRPAPEQPKVSALVRDYTRDAVAFISALRPHEIAYVQSAIAAVKGA